MIRISSWLSIFSTLASSISLTTDDVHDPQNITKNGAEENTAHALKGVNISIADGEFVIADKVISLQLIIIGQQLERVVSQ